jgi:uncharacterized protein (UPF0333 family)
MVFDKFVVGKRGQLSVEFILIVLVVLVLIETIILPLRDYSESSVKDVIAISYLEEDISKIQNAINSLSAYSEGKLTVNIHVPEDSNFLIFKSNDPKLNVGYWYSYLSGDMNYNNCKNGMCNKELFLGTYTLGTDEFESSSYHGFGLYGPIDEVLTITKQNNIVTISK